MNQKQAQSHALRIAVTAVQNALDSGQSYEVTTSDRDAEKVAKELNKIAQSLFRRWSSSIKQDG